MASIGYPSNASALLTHSSPSSKLFAVLDDLHKTLNQLRILTHCSGLASAGERGKKNHHADTRLLLMICMHETIREPGPHAYMEDGFSSLAAVRIA